MFKRFTQYSPLSQNGGDVSDRGSFDPQESFLNTGEKDTSIVEADGGLVLGKIRKPSNVKQTILCAALAISLITNIGFASRTWKPISSQEQKIGVLPKSAFAELEYDQLIPWSHYTEYATTNLTRAAELWDAIDFSSGFIALPLDYAGEKGIPLAQPFPWDSSKGIYVVNAYHSMHCLKSIHQYIRESDLGLPRSFPLEHITHCLDSFRKETLCSADDTPRWTSADPAHTRESGVGQFRQCRDWKKLEAWVQEYNSCYQRIDEKHQCINELERYKFCPKGSPYDGIMRQYFEVVMGRVLPEVVEEKGEPGMCEEAKDILGAPKGGY